MLIICHLEYKHMLSVEFYHHEKLILFTQKLHTDDVETYYFSYKIQVITSLVRLRQLNQNQTKTHT